MKILKTKQGFTLIELLVVIGILAVLAAIAIPSVAGLIDRANVSADSTNANEMTNALERFASEYELYLQDIASGKLDTNNLDSAQGRVYNVTWVTDRAGIEALEKDATAGVDTTGKAIYRDTKYPVNAETMQAVVENYMKTSSTTFTPKQSDCHYYYSPDCGLVVCTETEASDVTDLNKLVQSGKDAKGKDLGTTTKWIDLTANISLSDGSSTPSNPLIHANIIPEGGEYIRGFVPIADGWGTDSCTNCTDWCSCNTEVFVSGDNFPTDVRIGDVYFYGDYAYMFGFFYDGQSCPFTLTSPNSSNYISAVVNFDNNTEGWEVAISNTSAYGGKKYAQGDILESINNVNVTNMGNTFSYCTYMETFPKIPKTITTFGIEPHYSNITKPSGTLLMPCHLNSGTNSYCIGSTDGGFSYEYITVERYHYEGCGH